MRITKIERQKKRPSRKSIFIDGSFAFGVSDDILLKFALHEGALLNEGMIEKIIASDHEETAKQKALRFLAIRPRSKKEIRDYLSRKEFSAEIAERIIGRLETLNMLDDACFRAHGVPGCPREKTGWGEDAPPDADQKRRTASSHRIGSH